MTFRTRILLAQAPLGIALALVAVLAVRTVGVLGISAEAILTENYRSVLAAQRMQSAIEALDREALFRLSGRGQLDAAAVDRQTEKFGTELAVEENNITEEGEESAAAELHRRWDVYRAHYTALRGLDPAVAVEMYFRDLAPDFLAVRQATDRILDLNQDAMLRKSDRDDRRDDDRGFGFGGGGRGGPGRFGGDRDRAPRRDRFEGGAPAGEEAGEE